jgi:uncharacterized protein (DUF2267 family)
MHSGSTVGDTHTNYGFRTGNTVLFGHRIARRPQLTQPSSRGGRDNLGVLGERLTGVESDALADELPDNLAAAMDSTGDEAAGFSPEEFVEWVREAEREQAAGLDVSAARLHVQAVLESLSQSVDGDVWNAIRSQLPSEYERLYETA